MLQKLANLRLNVGYTEQDIVKEINKKVGSCRYVRLDKLSLDCRRKNDIHYVASVIVDGRENISKMTAYTEPKKSVKELLQSGVRADSRPVIIGSGPAGMFAGLVLASCGLRPIIFERGDSVENRRKKVDGFINGGELDEETNIQFGEGGAGTFSDGKLNTGISSEYIQIVLHELVRHGAKADILYDAKPHIGTDILQSVVADIRRDIISMGGEYHFNSKVDGIEVRQGRVVAVKVGDVGYPTDNVILATGHSARDTVTMLYRMGADMEAKSFAVGMRVEHRQEMLDIAQYGSIRADLPASDYKLSHRLASGKGCFTFCMCPGGYVMPSASERDTVVTNGMSEQKRDNIYGNSAVLVGVDPIDYGGGVLDGFAFQRELERRAYNMGGDYSAPAVLVSDFMRGDISSNISNYHSSYSRGLCAADIDRLLPRFVVDGMRDGLCAFGRKVRGFDREGVLIGVESRSSSPVRILRGEHGMSNIEGLYPCGEGAGYAGGITSSAVDGIKTALKLIERIKSHVR